jgi:hypothetical protein
LSTRIFLISRGRAVLGSVKEKWEVVVVAAVWAYRNLHENETAVN